MLHGVGEDGIALVDIAGAIGEKAGVPLRAITADEAGPHFGWLAGAVSADLPASSAHTRDLLGWAPTHPGLLADIAAL